MPQRTYARRLARAGALALAAACSRAARSPSAPPPSPQATPAVRADPADVRFMTGMIVHHAQALLMAGWAASHDAAPAVRTLCERILVSQRDEIAFMERWLAERGEPVPAADPHGLAMPGMDQPMLMPGMLSAAELARLDAARGAEFDRLFLAAMIRHHQGAVAMVQELLGTPGAARDGAVFRFAADVNADQTAEIARMTRMLAALPAASGR